MKKQHRFKVGDKVWWNGTPNEFRDNRHGTIINIKNGIAFVDDWRNKRIRQVPLKILKLEQNGT